MKNLFIFLFLCYCSTTISAQIISFSDPNFKNALVNSNCVDTDGSGKGDADADLNNDGEIEISEANAVSNLYIKRKEISNLGGIEFFTELIYLYCNDNLITGLDVSELKNLKELNCSSNQLTSLNVNGLNSLKTLNCSTNQLSNIDLEGVINLTELSCESNLITSLNFSDLNKLSILQYSYNPLKTLDVSMLPELEKLYCYNCQLTNLSTDGLTNLKQLYCSENELNELDLSGLENLEKLICYKNLFTELDLTSLTNLNYLECQYNNLTSLNVFGLNKLTSLRCYENQLTTLEISNLNKLGILNCTFNHISSLDVSGANNLFYLDCRFNKLVTLIIKNGIEFETFFFNNNEDLSYICCNKDEIDDIKSKAINYGNLNCEVNSYCTFYPGGKIYTLQGESNYDLNNDGCNETDFKVVNLNFSITDGILNGNVISNYSGKYTIPVQEGTHTITPIIENPDFFEVTPPSITVTFPSTSDTFTQDFCITPKGIFRKTNITVIPLTPPARPGFNASYKIVWENVGNQIESGTLNFTYKEALLDYLSALKSPDQIADGILKWDFTDLQPFEKREIVVTLKVNKPTDTPAVNAGDKLYLTASILDNIFTLENTVVGSYDPNDKTCLQGDRVKPDMVGEYVDYLIRFENTGNYPAENVVVKDIINTSMFDVSTLQITDTSHPMYTRIEDNKVEFIFENIQLPFEDDQNDGYVAFKLKSLPSLLLGDSLKNLADIYFDYNFPIRTNEAQTTINNPITSTLDVIDEVKIYPNPVNDILYIESIENWKKAEIYDVSGRIVRSVSLEGSSIDVSSLESGTYIVKLKNEEKIGQVKISKI